MTAPKKQRNGPHSLRAIFARPTVIAAISLFGLVSALTGDGIADILSWVGLGIPVIVPLWAWWRRERKIKISTGNKTQ